jgi:uncharacterized membrane protein (DUF485 family)
MKQEIVEAIMANPKYQELVSKRGRFAWILSSVVLIAYFSFILIIAFEPKIFAASMNGGVTSIGIPVGIGIIVLCFILAGIYTRKANGEFDKLTQDVKDSIKEIQ